MAEFGRHAFPWFPSMVQRQLAKPLAKKMKGYRAGLGINDKTIPGIEAFAKGLIINLERHFAAGHSYLMGERPCLGDFSLYGPLWSHIYRDPGTTSWFKEAPHVVGWFRRLQQSPLETPGEFASDDKVPETLNPIFKVFFTEQFSFITQLVAAIDRYCSDHPDATRVPRSLGDASFTVGGRQGTRKFVTFTQWMAQRPVDHYQGLTCDEREHVNCWLDAVDGRALMQLQIKNPFARVNNKMGLKPHSPLQQNHDPKSSRLSNSYLI